MEKMKKLVKEMKGYNTTTPTTHDETHPHPERDYRTTGDDRHPSIHEATRHGTTGPAGTDKPPTGRRRSSLIDRLMGGSDDTPPGTQKAPNDGISQPANTDESSGRRRSSGGASGRRRSSIIARLFHGGTDDGTHGDGTRDSPATGFDAHPSTNKPTHEGTAGPAKNTTSKSHEGLPPAGYP